MNQRACKTVVSLLVALAFAGPALQAADPFFLRRSLADVQPQPDDLTRNAKGASYKPLFGVGDKDADRLVGVARYGELTVPPGGASAVVSYPAEEQIYYILQGSGTLIYGGQRVPFKQDDYMYLPINVQHGIANGGSAPVRALVMGYKIPPGIQVEPTPKLMMSTSTDVELQILSGHGPTTKFRLLMGTTQSQRDRLAAASQMTSLFIMEFLPGGTNNPHQHAREEEIYILLRGSGDMVAGLMADGTDARHPSREGDVYFFGPGTRVGYYSNAKEGQPPDVILAARSNLPGAGMGMGRRGGGPPPAPPK
ncbi:MAG: cupin domain-containing protein [Bryobacterales bacterium]|nr:cupin domain-containing protein [Bryobacterales bacterium]